MLNFRRSQLKRYGVAILTVFLALLLTNLLWLLHKLSVYPLFFAAVMISSWYGGLKPGMLATVLSALVCAYFFLPPIYSLAVTGFNAVGLVQLVSDTGKGINPDFLPYVFERFRQADSTSTRSQKGLGLGLAIARHLVELHSGTINLKSQGIGQGATFTVKLPIRAVPSPLNTQTNNADQIQSPTVREKCKTIR